MERIGVLGDVHGNLPALRAVLDDAGGVSRWWCVGDVVGYGPYPNECVRSVAENCELCVVGNHDLGAVGALELSAFNSNARRACLWTGEVLDDGSRRYLESLVRMLEAPGVLLVHGSPRDPVWEYVLSSYQAMECFSAFQEEVCFHGHSHVPAVFRLSNADNGGCIDLIRPGDGESVDLEPGRRYLVNVGSVGQPRDGDPRASYAVYEPERPAVAFRRVEYPVRVTQQKMLEENLPGFLAERLELGL